MSVPTLLHPFAPPARTEFIDLVRGEGALVFDADGRDYVDAMAALWFCQVGYGRRKVVEAIADQAGRLHTYHCFDTYTNAPAEELAERIAGLAPVDDPRVFFANSGSEAIDTAIKLSRAAHVQAGNPQRQLIVSRTAGYHGTNLGGTSAQGIVLNQQGWGELAPNFLAVDAHDTEAMARVFAERGDEIAAVLAEPVQGAGGVFPPVEGWWPAIRRLCDDHGAHLIADEVICGFGRLGAWFGSETFGVRPDLITFAKGVSSGYVPLSGVIVGAAAREPLEADPDWVLRTGYTYSGHATACAAGLACADLTVEEGLLDRALAIGDRLRNGFASLVADGTFAGYRGAGAMYALETHDHQDPQALRHRIVESGVIVRPLPGALVACPPLVTTDAQVDRIVDTIAEVAAESAMATTAG